jgi:nucleoside-diphosphate-sugar epimerase
MNVLVIGGQGYFGSEIVNYLLSKKYTLQATTRSNQLPLARDNIKWISYDLNDGLSQNLELALNWCEVVIYNASSIKPRKTNFGLGQSLENEIYALYQLTSRSNFLASQHFIFISSGGSVYGELQNEILGNDESMTELPIDSYGKFKLICENVIKDNLISFKNFSILRISNIYSFCCDIDKSYGLITNLKNAALNETKFKLLGDGNNTRDYVNIFDVLRAIESLIILGPQACTINIGTGIETSVFELISIFNERYSSKIKVEQENCEYTRIKRSKLNIQTAATKLKWIPSIDLSSGINQYLSFKT